MENGIIKLREFDESDWDCYSGCETENPMITDISLRMDNTDIDLWYRKFDGCLVIDGDTIFVHVLADDSPLDAKEHYYHKTFHSEHHALCWLKRLDKRFDLSADLCLLHSWLVNYHGFTMDE